MSFILRCYQVLLRNNYHVSHFRRLSIAPTRAIREFKKINGGSGPTKEVYDGTERKEKVAVFYSINEKVRVVMVPPSLFCTQIMIAIQEQEKVFGNHIFVKEVQWRDEISSEAPDLDDVRINANVIQNFQSLQIAGGDIRTKDLKCALQVSYTAAQQQQDENPSKKRKITLEDIHTYIDNQITRLLTFTSFDLPTLDNTTIPAFSPSQLLLLYHGLSKQELTKYTLISDLPNQVVIFPGVSGLGKTRTALEYLAKNFGVLFTADKLGNGGSMDFTHFIDDTNIRELNDKKTKYFLGQLVMLRYLVMEKIRDTFQAQTPPKSFCPLDWLFFQLFPLHYFGEDIFVELFKKLKQNEECIQPIPGKRYPVVIDEFQVLIQQPDPPRYFSTNSLSISRPILTPIVRGLVNMSDKVILCGTSIDLDSIIEDLTSTVAKDAPRPHKFLHFTGIHNVETAWNYVKDFLNSTEENEFKEKYFPELKGRSRFLEAFCRQRIRGETSDEALKIVKKEGENRIKTAMNVIHDNTKILLNNATRYFFLRGNPMIFYSGSQNGWEVDTGQINTLLSQGLILLEEETKGRISEPIFLESLVNHFITYENIANTFLSGKGSEKGYEMEDLINYCLFQYHGEDSLANLFDLKDFPQDSIWSQKFKLFHKRNYGCSIVTQLENGGISEFLINQPSSLAQPGRNDGPDGVFMFNLGNENITRVGFWQSKVVIGKMSGTIEKFLSDAEKCSSPLCKISDLEKSISELEKSQNSQNSDELSKKKGQLTKHKNQLQQLQILQERLQNHHGQGVLRIVWIFKNPLPEKIIRWKIEGNDLILYLNQYDLAKIAPKKELGEILNTYLKPN